MLTMVTGTDDVGAGTKNVLEIPNSHQLVLGPALAGRDTYTYSKYIDINREWILDGLPSDSDAFTLISANPADVHYLHIIT